ncbi:tetratricopeptide repeat protein [uncultured Formosa sp.]|uniref:tetratricopeptide repeat protein n=1 Tax=uncultured Formosa sp. TaxID=255435 RepID=UPI002607848C|nr:tetratricopeptide repeat protein [uncultured Formosa sp.]
MKIIIPVDSLAYELFPNANGDKNKLLDILLKYYTIDGIVPEIDISKEFATITIDIEKQILVESKYTQLINLCEKGQLEEALVSAKKLVEEHPNVSEYYRILGQIFSDLGNQDEAVNSLIDALRWNPKNEYALIMMGNIFAKFMKDINTAMIYYNQVLEISPNDNITLNNIGANLMQLGKTEEAVSYFEKAIEANPEYPNTYFALAMVADIDENYSKAFKYALKSITKNNNKDQMYGKALKLAIDSATHLTSLFKTEKFIDLKIDETLKFTDKEIRIEKDETIPTAAKIEIAENYDRDYHLVKFKPNYPAVAHLVLHELMHLILAEEAREVDSNKLFISNNTFKSKFLFALEKYSNKMHKEGYKEEAITKLLESLFDGINRQVYNTPIDLFIEDRIFNENPEFRPLQFLSLLSLIQEGIEATTNDTIVERMPVGVLSKSKIFNIIHALHFKNLFSVDLVAEHKPTKRELNQASELYNEYLEYREDKEPGEEYELVQHWAEDLKLDAYFELVFESEYRRKTVESILEEINEDPFNLNEPNLSNDRKMKKFLNQHKDKDLNHAVAMHMVSALEYLKNLSKEQVKVLAFEFATLGMSGLDPNKDGYTIPSIEGKSFSGYKALAYYYVSWATSIPEMLGQLQLPFDKEYEIAKKLTGLE